MRLFIKEILLFSFFVILLLESIIRVNHLTIEIPRRQIDSLGIQKFRPNQSGYWSNGKHQWEINNLGWPGPMPESMDNLIALIGDSHIENLMNDSECQPAYLLKNAMPDYNFIQLGRAGASLIEFMEFHKASRREYKTVFSVIFVKDSDFKESMVSYGRRPDITQVDINNEKVINGVLRYPFLKNILYNFKLLYYIKLQIEQRGVNKNKINKSVTVPMTSPPLISEALVFDSEKLLLFIKKSYDVSSVIFALHPNVDKQLVDLFEKHNINYMLHKASDLRQWSHSETDFSHWNCYGFKESSKQVKEKLMGAFNE